MATRVDDQNAEESTRTEASIGHFFVTGCQRSGTTAMVDLLNADPRIAVGRERFKGRTDRITPSDFAPENFLHPTESDTNYLDADFYRRLAQKWQTGRITLVGDKVPLYYKNLPYLAQHFPKAKFIFLIRNLPSVAASYNARAANPADLVWVSDMDYRQAVHDWNESLSRVRKFFFMGHAKDLFFVRYEVFYSGDERYLRALYRFLGLKLVPEVVRRYRSLTHDWEERRNKKPDLTSEMLDHIERRKDRNLEKWCLNRCPKFAALASE